MKRLILLIASLFIIIGCGGGGGDTPIKSGSFDKTFANDGIYSNKTLFGQHSYIKDAVITDDNKIVIAGEITINGFNRVIIARLNSDGSLDTSFGNNGTFITNGSNLHENVTAMAIDNNGKIVVTGYREIAGSFDIFLLRLNSNGLLDINFKNGGFVIYDGGANELAYDLAITSDNKIYVAGTKEQNQDKNILVLKFKANGELDLSFANSGILTYGLNGEDEEAKSIALDSNENILLAQEKDNGVNRNIYISKFYNNGVICSSFANNGTFKYDSGKNDYVSKIKVDKNNNIFAVGDLERSSRDGIVLKLKANGTLDNSFGTNGVYFYDDGNDRINFNHDFVILNENLYVVAESGQFGVWDITIYKLNSNGKIDTSFANNGFLDYGDAKYDYANAIKIDKNNKLVVVGGSWMDSDNEGIRVYRINP